MTTYHQGTDFSSNTLRQEGPSEPVKVVEISALVVLRIVKHAHDNHPDPVTGPLLGLDDSGTVYVTDCFGYPQALDDEMSGDAFQMEALRCLREVNSDCNITGWYQSTFMGSFLNDTLIDTQYLYQQQIPQSVVLVFDPLQLSVGLKAFKALQLKPSFMTKYAEAKRTNGPLPEASSMSIFDEVEIKIVNPVLVQSYLNDMDIFCTKSELAALDLENQSYMEKNIAFLLDSLDYLGNEQSKMQYYERMAVRQAQQQKSFMERRRLENAARRDRGEDLLAEQEGPAFKRISMPSNLETLLISKQVTTYCNQVNDFASDAFGKLFLVGGLR